VRCRPSLREAVVGLDNLSPEVAAQPSIGVPAQLIGRRTPSRDCNHDEQSFAPPGGVGGPTDQTVVAATSMRPRLGVNDTPLRFVAVAIADVFSTAASRYCGRATSVRNAAGVGREAAFRVHHVQYLK
jgi:hypothetical protein